MPSTPTPLAFDARETLQRQLAIEWGFAREFVLGHIDRAAALWLPAPGSPTVRETPGGWVADFPDETPGEPMAPATIGWLLWHIEWWWTDTLATVRAGRLHETPPAEFRWSGGTDAIVELKAQWDEVLAARDLAEPVPWVFPEPQPLGAVAGWVNFELAKNLSEINQLLMLRSVSG